MSKPGFIRLKLCHFEPDTRIESLKNYDHTNASIAVNIKEAQLVPGN